MKMTPHEIHNPKRRLRAQRRFAIKRLADLRAEFPKPKPSEAKVIEEAKKYVTEMQNANVPNR